MYHPCIPPGMYIFFDMFFWYIQRYPTAPEKVDGMMEWRTQSPMCYSAGTGGQTAHALAKQKELQTDLLEPTMMGCKRWLQKKQKCIKGQWGVPLTVYPWYLLCSLGILGDYNPYIPTI